MDIDIVVILCPSGAAALSNSIAGSANLLTVSQLQQRILFLILKAVAVGRWSDHRI
jgi:hypothetical protein